MTFDIFAVTERESRNRYVFSNRCPVL